MIKDTGIRRFYHHTAPINMIYALHEAFQLSMRRFGKRYDRHLQARNDIRLAEMGLELVVEPEFRLPSLTTVYIPEGVDDVSARKDFGEYKVK